MEFEYCKVLQAQALVDIPDIGDFGLEAYNDRQLYYYLFVKTILGETYIATSGPIIPDSNVIIDGFSTSINHFQFNDRKIVKSISTFLNDYHKEITGTRVMTAEDVSQYFQDTQLMLNDIIKGRV